MPRTPKPWYRKDRNSWFVTISGKRHKLGESKKEAFEEYHRLMAASYSKDETTPTVAKPAAPSISEEILKDEGGFTVLEVIEKYLSFLKKNRKAATYDTAKSLLTKWGRENKKLMGQPIQELKSFQIQTWIDQKTTGSDTSTYNILSLIQTLIRWAKKRGHVNAEVVADFNEMEKPSPKKRQEYASPEDYQTIISHINEDDPFRDLVMFCWESGCRPQEAKAITKENVDLEKSIVVMGNVKAQGSSIRTIILNAKALEIVKKYVKKSKGPIFRNKWGNPWNRKSVNSRFKRLEKKTGVKMCQYMLRHGFATDLLINSVDIGTVAALMGHSDTSMVSSTYGHLISNPEFLREKLDRRTTIENEEPPKE